jgi:predicted adenylyl cyclase CyaB
MLYDANQGRPDELRRLWHYIDRFGHARRYLNWNPQFHQGNNLKSSCYKVPLPRQEVIEVSGEKLVEFESKYTVTDPTKLQIRLAELHFAASDSTLQRDEYYDTESKSLEGIDFVVRLRKEGTTVKCAFKGPRSWTEKNEYSRVELELKLESEESARREFENRGLRIAWYFEKKRRSFRSPDGLVVIELDEIPEMGFFAEIEGPAPKVREVAGTLSAFLGEKQRRNYQELFLDHKRRQGFGDDQIHGAGFSSGPVP